MKEDIRKMLEDVLPLVNFDSDFLFSELDCSTLLVSRPSS